jgi:NADPH2:quinone reductase
VRAAHVVAPRTLRVVEVPAPKPASGQVLVRVRACGVCASDLNAWRGVPGIEYPLPPGAPGHETWGDVVEIGARAEAAQLRVGQRVTGLLWNGLAELGLARAEDLVAISAPLLGEPLGCAMNVLRRAGSADLMAFVGFGYLAALCAQLLPASTRWIALSRRAESRALALRLGADAAYAFDSVPTGLWDSVPVVIEAAGVQQTLDFATWLTAYNGRLVIAGYHADGPRTVNMQSWNWKGLDVINAHDRQPAVIVAALRAGMHQIAARSLDLRELHTHEFELHDADAAFRMAENRPAGFVKAVVRLPA